MKPDLKKVPKWAWYASGAVIVSTVGYRFWANRGGGPEVEMESVDGTAGTTGTGPNGTFGQANPVGAVPVFMQSGGSDNSSGDVSWLGSAMSGAMDLAKSALGSANQTTETIGNVLVSNQDTWAGFVGDVLENQGDYNSLLLQSMSGGESPAAVSTTPAVNTNNGAPVVDNRPVPIAANPAAKPVDHGKYNQQNKRTGQWYWEKKASSPGRTQSGHEYKTGTTIHVYEDGHVELD